MAEIIESLFSHGADEQPGQIPVFSSTGSTVTGGSFQTLLRAAIEQILLQPIRWDAILEELQASLRELAPKTFDILPIGTRADQIIYTALKQTPLHEILLPTAAPSKTSFSEDTSRPSHGKSKLAIVGMSGRFPGAKDNEAFWDLL